eukprot:SAG31_NODE_2238_length_6119_cov_3.847508_5_plen_390_part_00
MYEGVAQRLASEPDWSALPELPAAGRTGFGLMAEMGRWNPPIIPDSETYTKLHVSLVRDGRAGAFRVAVDLLAAGCAAGLVDRPTASIAATAALKETLNSPTVTANSRRRTKHRRRSSQATLDKGEMLMEDGPDATKVGQLLGPGPGAGSFSTANTAAARDYGREIRRVGLADPFHFCYLLRYAAPDRAALREVVAELELAEADVPMSFHLYAALHRAYGKVGMKAEAADALARLQRVFAGLHASRQADVDEYNIVLHTCVDQKSMLAVVKQMEEAGVDSDKVTFMTCYKVYARAGSYKQAARILRHCLDNGLQPRHKLEFAAENTLKRLLKRRNVDSESGDVDKDAVIFAEALAEFGIPLRYKTLKHYPRLTQVLAKRKGDGDRPEGD